MSTNLFRRASMLFVLFLLVFFVQSSVASAAVITCPGRPDVTLKWSSTNPNLCTGGFTGDSGGVSACSFTPNPGGQKTVPNGNSCVVTYNCINASNQTITSQQDTLTYDPTKVWDSASATCVAPASPTLSVPTSPVTPGQSMTFTWTCPVGTVSSTGVGFSTGGQISGSTSVTAPNQTSYYQVTCTPAMGPDTHSPIQTVTVTPPNITITANPTRVNGAGSGGSSTITWTSSNVSSCTVVGPGLTLTSGNTKNGVGTASNITSQSTYTITCGGVKKTAIVNVTAGFVQF